MPKPLPENIAFTAAEREVYLAVENERDKMGKAQLELMTAKREISRIKSECAHRLTHETRHSHDDIWLTCSICGEHLKFLY